MPFSLILVPTLALESMVRPAIPVGIGSLLPSMPVTQCVERVCMWMCVYPVMVAFVLSVTSVCHSLHPQASIPVR